MRSFRNTRSLLLALVVIAACGTPKLEDPAPGSSMSVPGDRTLPIPVIFDTDIGGDADDLGALAMLHHLMSAGEVDLLAVMSWSNEQYAVPAIDGLNRYYDHAEVPIGARKEGIWHEEWMYNRAVAEVLDPVLTLEDVSETTPLYRRLLAAQPDSSVTLITVGPLLNIQRLLDSPPDSLSTLDGVALVSAKVNHVVIMGGHFPSGVGEWNFDGDMEGVTRSVLERLSAPTTFLGFEIGEAVQTGSFLNDLPPSHPLHAGFLHFSSHAPWIKDRFVGAILDNSSFDQTAVLHAVRNGVGTWWERIEGGHVEVDGNGDNRWIGGPVTNQSYLKLAADPELVARQIEALMLGEI